MSPFQRLGIGFNANMQEVKRAYAALIKTYRPDSHPVEFASIREAYDKALAIVQRRHSTGSASADGRLLEDEGLVGWPRDGAVTGRLSRWILDLKTATPHVPDLPGPTPRYGDVAPRMLLQDPPESAPDIGGPQPTRGSMSAPKSAIRDELSAILALSNAQGEDAAAARLEALLAKSRSMLLQDRIDLEHDLVRELASSAAPSLVLARIAAMEFDWAAQGLARRDSLDATQDERLKTVTALALDLAWFRQGGRAWLRHVFAAQASPPTGGAFAATSVLQEARRWTAHWSERARAVGVDVDRYIDAAARARLRRGAMLQSTDLLLGVALGALLSVCLVDRVDGLAQIFGTIVLVACATALVSALGRAAALTARHLADSPRWRSIASSGVHPFFLVSAVFLVGALLAILAPGAWQERGYAFMALACVPLLGWALQAGWTVLEATEDLLVAPLLDKRAALDRFQCENPASSIEPLQAGRHRSDPRARSGPAAGARQRGERPPIPGLKLRFTPWFWRAASITLFVALQFWRHWG